MFEYIEHEIRAYKSPIHESLPLPRIPSNKSYTPPPHRRVSAWSPPRTPTPEPSSICPLTSASSHHEAPPAGYHLGFHRRLRGGGESSEWRCWELESRWDRREGWWLRQQRWLRSLWNWSTAAMYKRGGRGTVAVVVVAGSWRCRRRLKESAAFSLSLSSSCVRKEFSELHKMKDTI